MKKYRSVINIGIISFLALLSAYLLYCTLTSDLSLETRHHLGISFTILTLSLYANRNVFTLALFVTLMIGNFGGLSSFPDIKTMGFFINIGGLHIPIYWGQPWYSVMLLIYLIFNRGFFTGIITKEYWQTFLYRKNDMETKLVIVNGKSQTDNDAGH